MDEIIEESLNVFFDVKGHKEKGLYDFKRIGVLWEHIDKYKLPKIIDRKTLDKLKEDPRAQKFVDKYHLKSKEELFQVEIDAMAAFVPVEFKKMILDHIKIYYQELIYRRLLSNPRYSEEQISLHVMKYVQTFLDELNIKLMWKWLEAPS
jgi:predicted transglutaminase-like protease